MEEFRTRPACGADTLLIELCGDHRAPGYPDVPMLLAAALGAAPQPHPVWSAETMIATDRYIGRWSYENGTYEIDDDTWACTISVPGGDAQVVADLEHALASSGLFRKV